GLFLSREIIEKHGGTIMVSGKHNNWSVSTNTGANLLDPGKTPAENIQFLVFLMAVIKAVDEYADMMRISASGAGNDHRLGANEAPPAIVSIFIGDELTEILKSIEEDKFFSEHKATQMEIGAHVLPHFIKDTTDRNRTSPFAFTGNKFEFRMLGSSASVASPNVVLNTAVAEALAQFYKELEGTAPEDMEKAVHELIKRAIKKHKKVIFNGNGYTDEWIKEAEKRGLYNLVSTPDALPQFIADKNVELFTKHGVFTKEEIYSRYEILLENYAKTINIESKTLQEMLTKDLIPAVNSYAAEVAANANEKKALIPDLAVDEEETLVKDLTKASNTLVSKVAELKAVTLKAEAEEDMQKAADAFHRDVLTLMDEMKAVANEAEEKIPDEELPYPTYDQMLFYI
ncbi:MAG: glutamine synthetase type III, partial [Lachnospiraceae bacterium]|nr:glutamine synthetase type III [Lachnospiraceae bacterium]